LRRLVIWISLTSVSIFIGLYLDLSVIVTKSFPILVRITGLTGIILVHFLLKRTGKLLRLFGECELWGWSTKLITDNIYSCVRHPHHLGVGLFMTFLAFLIGYPYTFLIITISQWLWVYLFVIFIEEKECKEKFGDQYIKYSKEVPMLIGNPICIAKELHKSINR
jgi:protein-S-isoprenylcysteine O-methyltransferase Ste14